MKRRCKLSHEQFYKQNNNFLFINNLHAEAQEQTEKITFFFVRKFIYLVFFNAFT